MKILPLMFLALAFLSGCASRPVAVHSIQVSRLKEDRQLQIVNLSSVDLHKVKLNAVIRVPMDGSVGPVTWRFPILESGAVVTSTEMLVPFQLITLDGKAKEGRIISVLP